MTKVKDRVVVADAEAQVVTPELTSKDQKEVRIIERVFENKEVAPQDAFGKLTKSQIGLIKTTIAKGASDDELRMFIQVCKGANLNPFLKQVHLVPRWDARSGQEVRTIQVGIDGFRAVAESSGQYAGNEDPVFVDEKEITYTVGKDKPVTHKVTVPTKATVTVYKLMQGQRFGFTATARWEEYYPGQKMGFQWHSRPFLMLGKCAEALALRKAFPKLLSGMYAAEEMEKTVQVESDSERQSKGLKVIANAIEKATDVADLKNYTESIKKSPKYTEEQKIELVLLIEEKVAKLGQNSPKTA